MDPRCVSHGLGEEELRLLTLAVPQAVPFVALLFFSSVIRIQILYETPDVTLPSQAPASIVFLCHTKVGRPPFLR